MTENDQKEQFSLAYVRALASVTGYSFAVPNPDDDSIDCSIGAAGRLGNADLVCSPRIDLQLKATSEAVLKKDWVVFRLPRKNYNDLRDPDPLVAEGTLALGKIKLLLLDAVVGFGVHSLISSFLDLKPPQKKTQPYTMVDCKSCNIRVFLKFTSRSTDVCPRFTQAS